MERAKENLRIAQDSKFAVCKLICKQTDMEENTDAI